MKNIFYAAARYSSYLFITLLLTVLIIFMVEGAASTASVLQEALSLMHMPIDHLQYDPELGWVGKPNVYIENVYGPGNHITRNALGFRSTKEFEEEVAVGKIRLLCLGDSLTFGFLMGDNQGWCERLQTKDDSIETINIAEPAYGVDQMYLRYQRDGSKFRHNILLLGITTMDIHRMAADTFSGMPKPLLKLEDGTISVSNIPVPPMRPSTMRQILANAAQSFRITPFLQSVFVGVQEQKAEYSPKELENLLIAVLRDIHKLADEHGASLVLIHLPVYDDRALNAESTTWGVILDKIAREDGFSFLPLVHDFQHLPPHIARAMFIEEYGHTHGPVHYNENGYGWVSEKIYEYLVGKAFIPKKH